MTHYVSPPEKVIPWLCYEESLTEKLKKTTGDASIQVLGYGLQRPHSWEKRVLGIQEPLEFIREIVMYSHEARCWYARTIAPESTYQIHPDFFARLEKNALHVMLFQEELAVRKSMHCYGVGKKELEFSWVKRFVSPLDMNLSENNLPLWVRRCCFLIGGKEPFYLVEIFLPQFWDLIT
ncbi:MAG: hypothetical protein A3F46_08370 [Legionellales bacterium RIFCSPHIGHO2_12_FULL_42_9]|nr:MAG: hypothetical protein A3F46_08370 [Legionellales bacterium RIFCSPHIGHO2_12_FULL_42_9]